MTPVSTSSNHELFTYSRGVFTGVAVGLTVPSLINWLEIAKTRTQVGQGSSIIKQETAQRPFKGLHLAIMNGFAKNLLLFSAIPLIRSLTDRVFESPSQSKAAAAGLASTGIAYVLYPLSFAKVMVQVQSDETFLKLLARISKTAPLKIIFAGVHPKAAYYGIYWSTYIGSSDAISSSSLFAQKNDSQLVQLFKQILAGILGGFLASSLSYPFDTLSNRLKLDPMPLNQMIKHIWLKDGYKGFFKGMIRLNLPRIAIAGSATKIIMEQTNQLFDRWENCRHPRHIHQNKN